MSLHTAVTALLCGLVLLFIAGATVYLCWQHPSASDPIMAGATVLGVGVAAIGFLATAARRRT